MNGLHKGIPFRGENEVNSARITKRIGARIGILGNPSDGFCGKTLSCMITNFSAEVWLEESKVVQVVPHPRLDPFSFANLQDLAATVDREGYYGGMRLLLASCKKFWDVCQQYGIKLGHRNFALGYSTTIPRQVGLAGSSAIVTGALKALMDFYGLTDKDIARDDQPSIALSVETEELDIQAGLQDRVVQIYGGLVYMDFCKEVMQETGHGLYEALDISLMPAMYVAYDAEGSDSGRVHRPMRLRWENGDQEVVDAMKRIAELAELGRQALMARDHDELARLMDGNLDERLRLYGRDALGHRNLHMVQIARGIGLTAKFAGSGGAVIGLCHPEMEEKVIETFHQEGFGSCIVEPIVELPAEVDHTRETASSTLDCRT